jgi:DNA-binding transcriptional LysR family regulator
MPGNGRVETEARAGELASGATFDGTARGDCRQTRRAAGRSMGEDGTRRGQSAGPWVGVEIRHLAALEAIEAERSFHGAADRLGYVQSAVSQQLSTLETLVGARLVERASGHTGVELTQAGMLLHNHATTILRQLSAARADLEALSRDGGNTIRVGGFQSVMTRIVPSALARLARHSPQVKVLLTETPTDGELFDAVAEGELDCAFAELPLSPGPFDAIELLVEPCVLLVHVESPLAAHRRSLTLADVATVPLAMPSSRMSDLIGRHFAVAGLAPQHCFCVGNEATVQAFASAGVAAGILPRLAADPPPPNTTVRELEGIPSRTVVLYWHRDRAGSHAMERFMDAVGVVVRRLRMAEPSSRSETTASPIALREPLSEAGAQSELAA